MSHPRHRRLGVPARLARTALPAVLSLALLAACGGGSDGDDGPPAPVAVGDTVALTASGKVISFNRAAPATLVGQITPTGLMSGETLVGLDVRPATGALVALTSAGRIYSVDASTGAVTLLSTLTAEGVAPGVGGAFTALSGTRFGLDFNPTVDRLRVVSDTGQNLRINVDNGATIVDGPLSLGESAPTGVAGAAYTNSFDGATATALYVLNAGDDSVYLQNPPNDGVLGSAAPLGVDFDSAQGFDIDPVSNLGYAALTVGGSTRLYTLPVGTVAGVATEVGVVAGGEALLGLALLTPVAQTTATAFGLTANNRLVRFNPRSPATLDSDAAITGRQVEEDVVGIDLRPADGRLYALTNQARVCVLNPATAALGSCVSLAPNPDQPGAEGPYTDLMGSVFSVDFNPVADRLRVLSSGGQSLRINVDNGLTSVDGSVNRPGGTATVVAAAYTNSFGPSPRTPSLVAPVVPGTQLMNLETTSDVLTLQDPPNNGTQVDVGPLGVEAGDQAAFDITGSRNGLALVALGSGDAPARLQQINLLTGAVTPLRGLSGDAALIGGISGLRIIDLALRLGPAATAE